MQYKFHIATLLILAPVTASLEGAVISDGSLGPFNPTGSQTINLETAAPDGILNYTTVNIPAGVVIRFNANNANTPVFIAATGDVVINGTVDVSAGNFNGFAGPGGGKGGLAGSGGIAGSAGSGPSPGEGGAVSGSVGNGGGGGGMATTGLVATSLSGPAPAPGGPPIAAPALEPAFTGGGGSGGGGGGHGLFFGVQLDAGVGGGGGGAVQVATVGQLTINGAVRVNGGHAGWAFANVFSHGGPGGGGSGGSIELYGAGIDIGALAVLQAVGGAGGGISTQPVPNDPYVFSSGAHGGQGYLRFVTSNLVLDPGATIEAVIAANHDEDGDGVPDVGDNCTLIANPSQLDSNVDGYGNACDPDLDNNGVVNFLDIGIWGDAFLATPADGNWNPDADFNDSGAVNFIDYAAFGNFFLQPPGPSGVAP